MRAIRLRTEYLTDPIGVDFQAPRLSWNCEGGSRQTAYRITAQDETGANVWDSGKVSSNQMHLIPWTGDTLRSREIVTWQVSLWDENGEEGEKSEKASFELGLLSPSDWTAKWITGAYRPNPKKRYPADTFSRTFVTRPGRTLLRARAYMTACGVYEGRMNGQRMGEFFLAPGITDYRKRVQYQTADITDLVRQGTNTVNFVLADGWYRGSVGAWGMKNYYGTETKLLAQIELVYTDGTKQVIGTDDRFLWSNDGPIRFADNKDGEIYDARLEKDPEGQDHGVPARITSHKVVPTASDNFELKLQERFENPKLIVTPSGKKVLDFGQNIAGIVEFRVQSKAGEKIFLRMGEKLDDAGEFTQKNIQCANKQIRTPLQQIDYTCKDGENHYRTTFAIFGFRFMQVEGEIAERMTNGSGFTAIAAYSDFETTFTFDSSNALLNQFVQNTLWALKNNSADLPTDCPTRERHGWSGDAQLFVNTAGYMVNYVPFALKYENDLCDWQTKDGKFPQIAPEGGTDFYMRSMNGSVGWADAGVMIPYRLWKHFQDEDIIRRYYPQMRSYAEFVIGRLGKWTPVISEKTGVKLSHRRYLYNTGQHYGEWAEPKEVHEMNWKDFASAQPEVATAYAVWVFRLMTEIAEQLGKTEDAARYREYADGCRMVYGEMVNLPYNSMDTDRQAKLVRPLYLDLLDGEQRTFAEKRLIKAMENYNWRVGTGFLSTPLILYVLQQIDLSYAYRLLENEEKPGWLFMPKTGATSIWEDWEGPTSDNGQGGGIASLDHYSKGAVCEWVFEQMCGIQVDGPNHVTLAPHPGGNFTHASMTYDSVYGTVKAGWEKQEDGTYLFRYEIPANTSADVILPEGTAAAQK